MNFSPLRVGLIGCGYWGLKLARVLAQNPAIELLWLADENPQAIERARLFGPSARGATQIAEVLEDKQVEAVVVAVPVRNHYAVTMAALRANKHVLVEKPLAATVTEAKEMVIEADSQNLTLMVGHVFLYNDAVQRVNEVITRGELGDLRYIFCQRLNLGVVRSDVSALWDLGAHDISIMDYWIGDRPKSLMASGQSFLQPGIADLVFAHLTYPRNIGGHLQVSWLDPAKVRRATIVGSQKMLIYDDLATDNYLMLLNRGIDITSMEEVLGSSTSFAQHQMTTRAGDVVIPYIHFREPLMNETTAFASSIRTGEPPLSDGHRGLRIVEILAQLTESMVTISESTS